MLQEGQGSDSFGSYSSSLLPFISDSSCSTYTSAVCAGKTNSPPQEALSISNYWSCSSTATASVLSFERGNQQEDDCTAWIDAIDQDCSQPISSQVLDSKRGTNLSSRLVRDQDCFEVESGSRAGSLQSPVKEKRQGCQDRFGLVYPAVASAVDGLRESIGQTPPALQKRQDTDACDMPSPKKQCGNTRKTKDKSSPSKDPQSIAAKNRRERISERLKILQDLVPNGTKVDLVTMLEKAISYVKFLQLQVKVLATDELWPAQGGRAPDISQVKEAIDAILSSQRDRSSCSKH